MSARNKTAAAEATASVPVNPLAEVPTVEIAGETLPDLTTVTAVSNPRKYSGVHSRATESKLLVKPGWKYADARFVAVPTAAERKPSSVFGTIQQIVRSAGKDGITGRRLATELRQRQLGNPRSVYCEALPPVGWAEGYIDSAAGPKRLIKTI